MAVTEEAKVGLHDKVEYGVLHERRHQPSANARAIAPPALVKAEAQQYAFHCEDNNPKPCDPVLGGRVRVGADEQPRRGFVGRCQGEAWSAFRLDDRNGVISGGNCIGWGERAAADVKKAAINAADTPMSNLRGAASQPRFPDGVGVIVTHRPIPTWVYQK